MSGIFPDVNRDFVGCGVLDNIGSEFLNDTVDLHFREDLTLEVSGINVQLETDPVR